MRWIALSAIINCLPTSLLAYNDLHVDVETDRKKVIEGDLINILISIKNDTDEDIKLFSVDVFSGTKMPCLLTEITLNKGASSTLTCLLKIDIPGEYTPFVLVSWKDSKNDDLKTTSRSVSQFSVYPETTKIFKQRIYNLINQNYIIIFTLVTIIVTLFGVFWLFKKLRPLFGKENHKNDIFTVLLILFTLVLLIGVINNASAIAGAAFLFIFLLGIFMKNPDLLDRISGLGVTQVTFSPPTSKEKERPVVDSLNNQEFTLETKSKDILIYQERMNQEIAFLKIRSFRLEASLGKVTLTYFPPWDIEEQEKLKWAKGLYRETNAQMEKDIEKLLETYKYLIDYRKCLDFMTREIVPVFRDEKELKKNLPKTKANIRSLLENLGEHSPQKVPIYFSVLAELSAFIHEERKKEEIFRHLYEGYHFFPDDMSINHLLALNSHIYYKDNIRGVEYEKAALKIAEQLSEELKRNYKCALSDLHLLTQNNGYNTKLSEINSMIQSIEKHKHEHEPSLIERFEKAKVHFMNNIAYFCALEEIDEFDAKRYAKQVLDFAPDNPAFTDTFAYVKYRFSLPRLDIGRKAKIEELKEALDLFEKAKKLALEQGSDWELTYKNADLHSSQASIAIERIEKR